MDRPRWMLWLPAIFAIVVLSFVGATVIGQWQMFATDRAALAIANGAAPGIEHLAAARGELRNVQVLMRRDLDRVERGAPPDTRAVQEATRALEEQMNEYLLLPVWPGEQTLWGDILRSKDALDVASTRFQAEAESGDVAAARSTLLLDVAEIADNLSNQTMKIFELNAEHSHDLALEIQRRREDAMYAAMGLDVVATLIAVAGAVLLKRMVTAHADLLERHRRMDEERASELEQFAGRVAHDILSPLNAVGFALEVAAQPDDEERRARVLARGAAALQGVKRLVGGLLDFARAGAGSGADARADVRATIADVAANLGPAAEAAGVALEVSVDGDCLARCNAGVLRSLVGNLAENAIKYIGEGADRRVSIRARHDRDVVHVEVEDTGPGLPPDIEHRAFELYSRAHGEERPGIGLGLATVKRLADAHGGKVGVESVPHRGCTFWFELPNAEGATSAVPCRPAFAAT